MYNGPGQLLATVLEVAFFTLLKRTDIGAYIMLEIGYENQFDLEWELHSCLCLYISSSPCIKASMSLMVVLAV